MRPPAPSVARADDLTRRGSAAVDAQDLTSAKKFFKQAAQLDPDNAGRRLHLAIVLEALKDISAAAEQLTEALRLDPKQSQAARRLSSLLSRQALPENARLSPQGLKAALQHDAISRDTVADAAIRYLSAREPLRGALAQGRTKGWVDVARGLCLKRTGPLLRDEVFLELLRSGVINSPVFERLLTALRRVLALEMSRQRFADRELVQFATALMQQCWVNEYIWTASAEELRAVTEYQVDVAALLAGGAEQGHGFLIASLYGPAYKALASNISAEGMTGIEPKAFGEAIAQRVADYVDEQGRRARIPRRGRFADETSRKVAQQYETAPYPRWTRLGMSMRGEEFRQGIAQYFEPGRLEFAQQPFEVLMAGCGTGLSAIQVALGFGANAHVLGLDLSSASLAYASRMAERFGAGNIAFLQADIREISEFPDFRSRFRVIDCTGVLHHMADTFAGWRSLLACLAPGGLMRIALYSATARAELTALRSDPAYPGAGCDDQHLRTFRNALMDRPEGEPGSELKASLDFYATSGFRDLALHVSEQCHSLPEIGAFLGEAGLRFRGFHPATYFQFLHQSYPQEPWPGSLERWADLERAFPVLFTRMYTFWCDRA
jgi:ubiquinone/menaquinone biosynthesis C-methylase UbiE/tetratricopeptide (TPR) repeat protein